MLGASRESLAAVRESLPARVSSAGVDPAVLSGELLSVASLLDRETGLRASLADPGTQAASRTGTVASILQGRVSQQAIEIVQEVVAARWSSGRDLVDVLGTLGADAAFIGAEAAGRLDTVEDELFRFSRTVVADGELQLVLGDPAVAGAQRAAVVRTLLEGRSQPETELLVVDAVANPRGRRIEDALSELNEQAAARRQRLLAEVRSAIALNDDQRARLAAALSRIYGRQVQLQVIVDPEVIGGVSVNIDDEVIDGTTAHRLEQARRLLTS